MNVPENEGFAEVAEAVLARTGLDLRAYLTPQLLRRLRMFAAREGARDLREYARLLWQDQNRAAAFQEFFSINVSEFFRNPDRFLYLYEHILPELVHRFLDLKVWSAGCANGAETYSLAILMHKYGYMRSWEILGTDIDPGALREAAEGCYRPDALKSVPAGWLEPYLWEENGCWKVRTVLRRYVRFRRHDLVRDPYPTGQHLIACRNVVIYLTPAARQRVWEKMAAALAVGGVLFIGGTESILDAGSLGLEPVAPCFFRRVQ